jgi:hypothetical protein
MRYLLALLLVLCAVAPVSVGHVGSETMKAVVQAGKLIWS